MERFGEVTPLLGVIDPDAYAAGTVTTSWVAMKDVQSIGALISVGTMASTSTVDAKLQQATDASGTGAKDITGKAITQLTQAGGDSDKQAIINCSQDELDLANDFTHVRLSITVATAASDAAGFIFGKGLRYGPAEDADLASVDEIVT